MKRKIDQWDEQVYRSVHPDFDGLSRTEAAKRMGCSKQTITNTLNRLEKIAPQLFPILTKREKEVYELADELDFTDEQIAILLRTTVEAVEHTIRRIRNKGLIISRDAPVILQYEDDMDGKIARKF